METSPANQWVYFERLSEVIICGSNPTLVPVEDLELVVVCVTEKLPENRVVEPPYDAIVLVRPATLQRTTLPLSRLPSFSKKFGDIQRKSA